MGVGKTPSHVGKIAMVSARWSDEIWVLTRSRLIPRSKNRSSKTITPGKRVKLVPDRVDGHATVIVWDPKALEQSLTRTVLDWDASANVQKDRKESNLIKMHDCR
ncbi:hypothetical protein HG531_010629 [Fusarium graminearum]|nr:hypothetical protein HG531_010629 [Fusarium graminearum]